MNRKKKIILNTFLILLCAFVLWFIKGFPLTNKGELRRFEKSFLLPDGEILTEVDTRANGPTYWIGKTKGYAEVFQIRDGIIFPDNQPALYIYELHDEGTVVILPEAYYGNGELMGAWCVFVYDNVPDASGAILSFDGKEFTGERCADGLIKFDVHYGERREVTFPAEMNVTYLSADGTALGTALLPVSPVLNYAWNIQWTIAET